MSIWRYGAENSAKRKFTAPRALFAAPEIKKYSALARAGLVRTCSDDGEWHAARVHARHCSTTSERGQVLFVSARLLDDYIGLHNSMRMRAAPRTIVAPPFQPQKTIFSTPLFRVALVQPRRHKIFFYALVWWLLCDCTQQPISWRVGKL